MFFLEKFTENRVVLFSHGFVQFTSHFTHVFIRHHKYCVIVKCIQRHYVHTKFFTEMMKLERGMNEAFIHLNLHESVKEF